jgi:hypothetical protein
MQRFIIALFCVFLFACQSKPKTCIQIVDGTERTIDYTPFQNLFKKTGYTDFKAGELNVSTGKMVILDPVFIENSVLLDKLVPTGKFPVYLFFTDCDLGYRIAYSMVQFKEGIPSKWEFALVDSAKRSKNIAALGMVKSGAGILGFSDKSATKLFYRQKSGFEGLYPSRNFYQDVLSLEFNKNGGNPNGSLSGGDWTNFFPLGQKDENLLLFSTGVGNNVFPAYWGLDENGKPMQLVLDFKLFENEEALMEIYNKKY